LTFVGATITENPEEKPQRHFPPGDVQLIDGDVVKDELWLRMYWAAIVEGSSESICNDIADLRKIDSTRDVQSKQTIAHLAASSASPNAMALLRMLHRQYPRFAYIQNFRTREFPLHAAARWTTNVEVLQFIFELHPEAALFSSVDGTPLHIAMLRSVEDTMYLESSLRFTT
jgi:hypothetical protein